MNIAVVGLGRWGRHLARNCHHLGVLQAVVDTDHARCMSFSQQYDALPLSFIEACESPDIDAVILAVPLSDHVPMVKQALHHGKHVWIEKPLCIDYEDALMLQALAAEKNRQVFVDYLPVYHPATTHLKSLDLNLSALQSMSLSRNAWGVWREEGALWDLICHDLAVLKYIWPHSKVQVVSVTGQKLHPSHTYCDQATVHLLWDNVTVQMQVSCMSLQKVQRFEVIGQNSGWLLDYQGKDILQQVTLKHSPMEMELSPVQLDEKEPLLCAVESFIHGITGEREMVTGIEFAVDVENIIRDIHCKL
jgi:predicted dehydrogenase